MSPWFDDLLAKVKHFYRAVLEPEPKRRSSVRWAKPGLEVLRARVMPAAFIWSLNRGSSGNWEDANNWQDNGFRSITSPGPQDSVEFNSDFNGDCVII